MVEITRNSTTRRHEPQLKKASALRKGVDKMDSTDDVNRDCYHLIGVCMYKEPLQLMRITLDSIARQHSARKNIAIVVGMEERTPDAETKKQELITNYKDKFLHFIVTIHPYKIPGELPGKCSNFNWASREAVRILKKKDIIKNDNYDRWLVTTCDCDTVFASKFFDTLEADWKIVASVEKQRRTVWQSPLFYQMGIEKSPFFVRIVGLLRAYFMMGFLIPCNINTMSVFSLSLWLYETADYTHPAYQMDDIIALIRWTLKLKEVCKLRVLYIATMSGPTSGATFYEELHEWARQIVRWTIGAAEVFHYFVVKAPGIPFCASVLWGIRFVVYYGLMLCVAPLFSFWGPAILVLFTRGFMQPGGLEVEPWGNLDYNTMNWVLLGLLIAQYFWFACVFLANAAAERTFPDGIYDATPWYRSILHWILALPTILAYCLVECYAFLRITIKGKSVCTHDPSKKDDLKVTAKPMEKLKLSIRKAGDSARRITRSTLRSIKRSTMRRKGKDVERGDK